LERKKGLIILFILFFSGISTIYISSLNQEDNSDPVSNYYENYLTTNDFIWNAGTAERNNTCLDGFTTGTGYTYDISSDTIHFLETTGTYDKNVGACAEVPVTNNTLSLTFYGRAKANYLEAVKLRLSIYDPVTYEEIFYFFGITGSEVYDSGFIFINKTFLLEGYDSILLFFFYSDGWSANLDQEFWVQDLKIYTDVSPVVLKDYYVDRFFAGPASTILGMTLDDSYLYVANERSLEIYRINKTTGNLVQSFYLGPLVPNNIEFDGEFFWILPRFSNTLYKYDSDFTLVDIISVDQTSRGGLASDGGFLWYSDKDNCRIYKIRKETGELVKIIDTDKLGYIPNGLASDSDGLWVTDRKAGKIMKVNRVTGQIITSFLLDNISPWGITVDENGKLWIEDVTTTIIYKLTIEVDDYPIIEGEYASFDWYRGSFTPNYITGFADPVPEDFDSIVNSTGLYVYEISSNYYHLFAGVFAVVDLPKNTNLNISFNGRATSSRYDQIIMGVAVIDPVTLDYLGTKRPYDYQDTGISTYYDTDYNSFNYTFNTAGHNQVILFFYYIDATISNWQQKIWVTDLTLDFIPAPALEDSVPPTIVCYLLLPPGGDKITNIQWYFTDASNSGYFWFFVNSSLEFYSEWNSSLGVFFIISLDIFSSGTYNFTLVVADAYGNNAYNTVIFTIEENITISTETTTPIDYDFTTIAFPSLAVLISTLIALVAIPINMKRKNQ